MFYRLGLSGWDQPAPPGVSSAAALNRSWVDGTLLPVLQEVAPHLPAILRGAMVGAGGAPGSRVNVTEDLVSARLYTGEDYTEEEAERNETAGSTPLLLVALRWNAPAAAGSDSQPVHVAFELGASVGRGGKVAMLLDTRGMSTRALAITSSGRLIGAPLRPGDVNVYRIVDRPAAATRPPL